MPSSGFEHISNSREPFIHVMNKLLEGLRTFQASVYPKYAHAFRKLADQQHPLAMMITCSDSRILPSLLLQCDPGDVFVCRNAGNIAPPYDADVSGVAASVEYALDVLQLRHVIVCGHSDCGAMKALLQPDSVRAMPAVRRWLKNADAARRIAANDRMFGSSAEKLQFATQENVMVQLTNLATYPPVAAALARGAVELHGWYYDIGAGQVSCFDAAAKGFVAFDGAAPLPLVAA
jgi:carbonic anhydrase